MKRFDEKVVDFLIVFEWSKNQQRSVTVSIIALVSKSLPRAKTFIDVPPFQIKSQEPKMN